MTTPRLQIDLDKIKHNALTLVERLGAHGIAITGVTKAFPGYPGIADVWLEAGVGGLGDSRVENIEAMRRRGVATRISLIRSPMMSQVERVIAAADISFNTELDVIRKLSSAAGSAGRSHGVVLMVELGDLREGIMPDNLHESVREVLRLPNIQLKGIGTNLACRSGVAPDQNNMGKLSALADSIDAAFGTALEIVSGGNSASIKWALGGGSTGRINDLRLGESLLLGLEPLHRQPIDGLHGDAITLVAEVIEHKVKPTQPWGEIGQTAFGAKPPAVNRGHISQTILAIGCQDVDPDGLRAPVGTRIIGASSDHLVLDCGNRPMAVGAEVTFGLDYSALVRAMTSPFVDKVAMARKDVAERDELESPRMRRC
ncbi:MAG: alanine/ornithine racemase family PLP-dependent enzyme [Rhodospirillales bacterium]|nr:alanine/ornithine racemase family PLP-dependent enzyme [Rhodospirillales bacterium]